MSLVVDILTLAVDATTGIATGMPQALSVLPTPKNYMQRALVCCDLVEKILHEHQKEGPPLPMVERVALTATLVKIVEYHDIMLEEINKSRWWRAKEQKVLLDRCGVILGNARDLKDRAQGVSSHTKKQMLVDAYMETSMSPRAELRLNPALPLLNQSVESFLIPQETRDAVEGILSNIRHSNEQSLVPEAVAITIAATILVEDSLDQSANTMPSMPMVPLEVHSRW